MRVECLNLRVAPRSAERPAPPARPMRSADLAQSGAQEPPVETTQQRVRLESNWTRSSSPYRGQRAEHDPFEAPTLAVERDLAAAFDDA
jgi:hypothetical protein